MLSCHVCHSGFHRPCFNEAAKRSGFAWYGITDRSRCPLCRTYWTTFKALFALHMVQRVVIIPFAVWLLRSCPTAKQLTDAQMHRRGRTLKIDELFMSSPALDSLASDLKRGVITEIRLGCLIVAIKQVLGVLDRIVLRVWRDPEFA